MCEKDATIAGGRSLESRQTDLARKQSTMCDMSLRNEHGGGVGVEGAPGASDLEELAARKSSVEESAENAARELEVSRR